jgi:hypothetical protein
VPREINLEKEIDRLYAVPAEEFTGKKKELANKLRGQGERAAAMRVEDLRKPTAAAAAVNHLARNERMNIRALLAAGDRLREAQTKLLRGASPTAIHKAADDERKALSALVAAARREGASDPILRKVEQTLRAAAIDEDARALLQEGRLTQDLQPIGFGFAPEQLRGRTRSSK